MRDVVQIIDELFFRHYDHVVRIARRYAPVAELVGDVVQQAYVEFSQKAKEGKWDLEADISPLLYRLTRFIALRQWREHQKASPDNLRKLGEYLQKRYEQQERGEDRDERRQEDMRRIRHCLGRLSDKNKELIDKRYYWGMSNAEIAESKGIPLRNVQQIIRRIREKIRQCLEGR